MFRNFQQITQLLHFILIISLTIFNIKYPVVSFAFWLIVIIQSSLIFLLIKQTEISIYGEIDYYNQEDKDKNDHI
jgi:ABC-type transport system involved in multi-copper enzyme maturation permease subunit